MQKRIKSRIIALIATGIISGALALNASPAEASSLKDIDQSSEYAQSSIAALYDRGLISGDQNGNFNPRSTTTRAEMITIIVRALGIDTSSVPATATFKDVPAGHWAFKYVEAAYRAGLVKGISSDVFGVDAKCTREQMAVLFSRSIGLKDDVVKGHQQYSNINGLSDKNSISSWAVESVEFAFTSGLMKGTSATTFDPAGYAPREQIAVLIDRFIGNKDNVVALANTLMENSEQANKTEAYTRLTEAFNKSENYKGEFTSKISVNAKETISNESYNMSFDMNGAINGTDSYSNVKYTTSGTGMPNLGTQYEVIKVGDKIYMKSKDSNSWTLKSIDDLNVSGIEFMNPGSDQDQTRYLLENLNKLPVEKSGTDIINGVPVTKYTMTLDQETMKQLLPQEYLDQMVNGAADLDSGALTLKMDIYLNESNQVIKEVVVVNTEVQNQDAHVLIEVSIEMNYSNIGATIEIKAPVINNTPTQPALG